MTTLLVASTGGHLKQLHRLRTRLSGADDRFRWATFDTPQSRSLLAGEEVDFVRFVGSRDPKTVLQNGPTALRILRKHRVQTVVSTGAAVALPFIAMGRLRGLSCHYIESAARSDGPSITGRLISKLPGVNLYAQYPTWARRGWAYRGSVFDSFVPTGAPMAATDSTIPIKRVVVTLGTSRGYGFGRLVARLLELLPSDVEVLWQTGGTDVRAYGVNGHKAIPEHELRSAMAAADVVVSHAGVGNALTAFEVGQCPILVPRRASYREHVDDHQVQITRELARRGLALGCEVPDLSYEALLKARSRAVTAPPTLPSFALSIARS